MPTFRAIIRKVGPGYWVDVPADVVEQFGGARHVPVTLRYAGDAHPSTLSPGRAGTGRLAVHADALRHAGLAVGDELELTVTLDQVPRTLLVPPELARALACRPAAAAGWESAAPSTRRVVVEQFTALRSPEARARRVEKLIEHFAEYSRRKSRSAKSRSKSA